MSELEGVPNSNGQGLNSPETQAVVNPDKNIGEEPASEVLAEAESGVGGEGESEPSPENRLDNPEGGTEEATAVITDIINRINIIDEEIFRAKVFAGKDKANIEAVRENLRMSSNIEASDASSTTDFVVVNERDKWIEKYGSDNLPEGLAVGVGEDGREAKGTQLSSEKRKELTIEEKEAQTEKRKEWLEAWKTNAVTNFERGMRSDWRTRDANNLDLTIEVMKLRVPNIMENEMKDFVEGKNDEPPSVVWIRWKCNGLFDHILGKPNMIRKLEITFDEKVLELAGEEVLEGENKESDKSESEPESKRGSEEEASPVAPTPELNPAGGSGTEPPKA